MRWLTRDHVHLDRVAASWLIRRFIDAAAEFEFVPAGTDITTLASDAIAFGLPGVKLSAHDASGSSFRKIMREYQLATPALELLAALIEDAIAHFLREKRDGGADIGLLSHPEAVGLIAVSEGMMYDCAGDLDIIEKGLVLYDALYAFCQARILGSRDPSLAALPPFLALPKIKPALTPPPLRQEHI